jgi:hypothetical protein
MHRILLDSDEDNAQFRTPPLMIAYGGLELHYGACALPR